MSAAEIVFKPENIRKLSLTKTLHIDSAHVEGHRVELQGVKPNARLCLKAESRALHQTGPEEYELRNGPYMRRFLDGYYPMRIYLNVKLPESYTVQETFPQQQLGFSITQTTRQITLDGWFKGKLFTRIRFSKK